ncbi:hypothetical protein Dfri01_68670 [Dyadobacter frigoris]|uniref:hypothetical protein n=1 Tax=Dyadobacter frigoris TaxID=2576211 RepID=UPI0024A4C8FB|nr:hypothetical protein [Dyadobacter frigoris]GLU57406.1 hypothetical protein Dfri01_68670 [Dyadobacter frigoris]
MLGIVYESETEKAKSLTLKCIESGKKIVRDDVIINFVVEEELAANGVNLKV